MKHSDLLGENAQVHNKVYQMLRDRILKIMETALIYGEIADSYLPDTPILSRLVDLGKSEKVVVDLTYENDEYVTMTAHIPDGDTTWAYIWSGGLVNVLLVEDAIKILDAMEKQDGLRESYLDKRDAWVQKLEIGFQSLGGVKTRKMKAADYVAMRKEGNEE